MQKSCTNLRVRPQKGATSVEFALVAPILFLVVFAAFQFGGLMLVQNVLTAAAREGSRVASLSSTDSSSTAIDAARDRLSRGGVDSDLITIVVNPTVLNDLATGDEVTVTVSGQTSQLTFFWSDQLPNPTLSATMTYNRE